MDAKYIALVLLAFGVALIVFAAQTGKASSFEDGSFLVQIVAGIVGAFSIAMALIIFLIRLWIAL